MESQSLHGRLLNCEMSLKILSKQTTPLNKIKMKITFALSNIMCICWVYGVMSVMTNMRVIRDSEINPGALMIFQQSCIQKCFKLQQRAYGLHMKLAHIMDPPFNSDRNRVKIEKIFNSSVKVRFKPKHLTLAKSMFDDDLALTPSRIKN